MAFGVDDLYSSDQLLGMVKKAHASSTLLVLLFHGVGGEHRTNLELRKHYGLVQLLEDNRDSIWVAPLVEIIACVQAMASKMSPVAERPASMPVFLGWTEPGTASCRGFYRTDALEARALNGRLALGDGPRFPRHHASRSQFT